MSVMHLVAVKIFDVAVPSCAGLFAGLRILAVVAIVRVKVIVDVSTEAGGTVEPWAGSDEDAARKPLRAVVAIRGAGIGRSLIVAVGAVRSYSNADSHLRF
jgi:hypothetical protein